MNFVDLGAITLNGICMTFGLLAMNFVAMKVIYLFLDLGWFFFMNVKFNLLSINDPNLSDITGLPGSPLEDIF